MSLNVAKKFGFNRGVLTVLEFEEHVVFLIVIKSQMLLKLRRFMLRNVLIGFLCFTGS